MVATSLLRATRRAAAPLRRTGPRAFSSASAERERLVVFDTTLRDGEQSPGATMTGEEKVSIAKSLSRLGVDVCEAGFPIASNGDFEAVKAVAETAGHLTEGRDPASKTMRIAGLSRANEKDIARCYDAVRHAPLHRVHTFIASSEIHLKHKLNITRAQCLETAAAMVAFARGLSSTPAGLDEAYDIEFSAEDSGRSDPDFLVELCTAVIEAGATTINLPDTVGYMVPEEYGSLFACAAHFGAIRTQFGAAGGAQLRRAIFSSSHPRGARRYLIANTETRGKQIVWSTHCHNDLGLATANSLAAVQQGARQIEVTLNGIGERAGNTSLEECVMALRTRQEHFPVYCGIDTKMIMKASKQARNYGAIPRNYFGRLRAHVLRNSPAAAPSSPPVPRAPQVSSYTGIAVQANKAIVGANAFAHESGIHQHGVLKHAETYEIMTPESVGIDGDPSAKIVLGKHSGKAAFKSRLVDLGFDEVANNAEKLNKIVEEAKTIADKKKTISDWELEALANDDALVESAAWEVLHHTFVTAAQLGERGHQMSTASVTVKDASGATKVQAATGVGPVDATFKALSTITGREVSLLEYVVTKIEGGSGTDQDGNDALASVMTRIAPRGDAREALPSDFPGSSGTTVFDDGDGGIKRVAKPIMFTGTATSTDIVVASARAYLSAINRMIAREEQKKRA